MLLVPVGALGAPAGRLGARHGAAAARLALLLHLLPRRRAARGRARVPEPGRPRLLRRREPGGRRAGAPRGAGARRHLHQHPAREALQCALPRASGPHPRLLQRERGRPGHPSWHLAFPWAGFWSSAEGDGAAPLLGRGDGRLHRPAAG